MKNASMFFNALLLALVAVLFFMYFSLKSSLNKDNGGQSTNNTKQSSDGNNNSKGGVSIAYINDDTITANYSIMKELSRQLQSRQVVLQGEYETKAKKLQDEYNNYQQKAQSGNLSQIDAQKLQEDMQNKKAEVDGLQHKMEDLVNEAKEKNQKILDKVLNYVTQYNKSKHYDYVLTYSSAHGPIIYANNSMDITRDILAGLNKEYNDSISAKH
ncbi:MAG TPA: OmpH family outer membrane protein [Bacteroidia bacterium]|jgi:outer membrane protein|nr:OmpH family outer membrane protein [Bacteroidia bacterium]